MRRKKKATLKRRSRLGMKRFTRWMRKWSSWSTRSRQRQTSSWPRLRATKFKTHKRSSRSTKTQTLGEYLTSKNFAKAWTGLRTTFTFSNWAKNYRKSLRKEQFMKPLFSKKRTLSRTIQIRRTLARDQAVMSSTATKWSMSRSTWRWRLSSKWKPHWPLSLSCKKARIGQRLGAAQATPQWLSAAAPKS